MRLYLVIVGKFACVEKCGGVLQQQQQRNDIGMYWGGTQYCIISQFGLISISGGYIRLNNSSH